MFKKKAFLVKMVDEQPPAPQSTDTTPKKSPESIAIEVATGVGTVGVAVVSAYLVGDTFRQIAIHTAKTFIK